MNQVKKAIEILGSATRLAKVLGVTPQAVCFWRDGLRKIPIKYCYAIESATNGQVKRQDLIPDDWHTIWPELIDKSEKKRNRSSQEAGK